MPDAIYENGAAGVEVDPSAASGLRGHRGWSMVTALVADGERRVRRLVDWIGGQGEKPDVGLYVGPLGLVSDIADATDDKGAPGRSTYQIAVDNGFIGSEAQWLDSFVDETAAAAIVQATNARDLAEAWATSPTDVEPGEPSAKTSAAAAALSVVQASAALGGVIHDTTGDGIAATIDGQFFIVKGDGVSTYASMYKNVAGVATLVSIYPSNTAPDVAVLSGVGGTGAAYTASASAVADNDGKLVVFTPHVTSVSSLPSLAINGGSVRSIIDPIGGLIPNGSLRAGVPVILRRVGVSWRVVDLKDGIPVVSTAGTASAYTGTIANVPVLANRTIFLLVPHVTNALGATIALNGGAAGPLHNMDASGLAEGQLKPGWAYLCIWAGGAVRMVGVPAIYRDTALEHTRTAAGVALSMNPQPLMQAGSEHDVHSVTEALWSASPADRGKGLYLTGTRWIDLRHLRNSVALPYRMRVGAGAAVKAFSADTTWTLPAGSITEVTKATESDYIWSASAGAVTQDAFANDPPPACDYCGMTAGQSLAESWLRGDGMYGLQMGWRAYQPANPKTFWMVDGSVGGTALLKAVSASAYWWDLDTHTPGPSAIEWQTALNAIPAAQPDPSFIYYVALQSDVGHMGTTISIADVEAGLNELFAWMRAEVGNPTLPIIMSPLGSEDNMTSQSQSRHSAARWAQMNVIAADANVHLGPRLDDLPRPYGDVHLSAAAQRLQGFRLAAIVATILEGAVIPKGPTVDQIEQLEGGKRYRIRIQAHSSVNWPVVTEDWPGLVVLPAGGDPLASTPLSVERTYVDGIGATVHFNVVLRAASPGAIIWSEHEWGWKRRAGRIPRNDLHDPLSGAVLGWGNLWALPPIKSGAF